ncbi:sensor histidine kinase [Gleimia europaea]|uniref:sensor histidine kinase n=1 Tax=Gleimia europaea TaxID=66228 RepID=UPI00278AE547|nr:ATP-binding protein [Gleimia europaea]MDP9833607.1 signal transduction histidine kinase [Gleimia europaea]
MSVTRVGGDSAEYMLHILAVAADESDPVCQAASDIEGQLKNCDVRVAFGFEQVERTLASQCETGQCLVPGVLISPHLGNVDEVVERLRKFGVLARSGFVLITDKKRHEDVARSVNDGSLVSVVAVPWTPPALVEQVSAVINRWLFKYLPDAEITRVTAGFDAWDEPRAGDLLYGLDTPGEQVQRVLLEGIERILGPRPRMVLPEGVDLTRQGESVDAVYLVLSGSVALHRSSQFGDVLLHHATSGPLIGLLSLARQQRAMFTSTTTTQVELVRLSIEQLEFVLQHSPDTSANLAVVAIQALTARLVRAEYLHIENHELAEQLEMERKNLSETLQQLRSAREQLVEQTKFAMLGELSAGIAHELNNPVAALQRATEHIASDVATVLAARGGMEDAAEAMVRARDARPRSTAQERALVREVMALTDGNRELAKRLVGAGITDPDQVRHVLRGQKKGRFGRGSDGPSLEVVEAAAGIGRSVRNSTVAAGRITDLVSSLKAYARPDTSPVEGVDLDENIEDVLRLTAHRMRGVEVESHFADLPPIRAYPARLEQVWTNLLINAAEAIQDEAGEVAQAPTPSLPARGEEAAKIVVETSAPDEAHVRVAITDNGPGIPQELVHRILEPHFTTKGGQVRFGLGMGMSISKSIVDDHEGSLSIASVPGRTTISVVLPVAGSDVEKLLLEDSGNEE